MGNICQNCYAEDSDCTTVLGVRLCAICADALRWDYYLVTITDGNLQTHPDGGFKLYDEAGEFLELNPDWIVMSQRTLISHIASGQTVLLADL